MTFKQKYNIKANYLTTGSKRRSGQLIFPGVKFIVAHDTGNSGSTAAGNISYYQSTPNDAYSSAHLFVDDKEIIECIPALTSDAPEKAWHVRYNTSKDNELYGYEANDTAIGVEYCHGPNINADEAYDKYVWTMAYICYKYNLNPATSIIGHFILDPSRRNDPVSGLSTSGRTYDQLLLDIKKMYNKNLITNQLNTLMKLIQNQTSKKVYAIGVDNKKYWVFNEETFNTGQEMGLWGDWSAIEISGDDTYQEGHAIILIK